MLQQYGFSFGRELPAAVTKRLQGAGFQVKTINFVRDESTAFIEDYSKLTLAGTDAVLDLATGGFFGYANVSIVAQLRP